MTRKAILALNMQPFFHTPAPLVAKVNELGQRFPLTATLFVHDESQVPYQALTGKQGPQAEACLAQTEMVFKNHGYELPQELIDHLKSLGAEEVVVVGGQTDEHLLSAGFSLFNAGFKASLVPELCYQNNWFEHGVTVRLWENAIGKVYESAIELM